MKLVATVEFPSKRVTPEKQAEINMALMVLLTTKLHPEITHVTTEFSS